MYPTTVCIGLVTCFLPFGLSARAQELTDVKLRMVQLTVEVVSLEEQIATRERMLVDPAKPVGARLRLRIDLLELEGKLEQAKAEQGLLQKVTTKTVPPPVEKDVEIARLANRAKVAERKGEQLKQAVKEHPTDLELALELLSSNAEKRQARAEHGVLQKEPAMLADKGVRAKRVAVQIEAMQEHLRSVQALLRQGKNERARVECAVLEAKIRAAETERNELRKESQREPKP